MPRPYAVVLDQSTSFMIEVHSDGPRYPQSRSHELRLNCRPKLPKPWSLMTMIVAVEPWRSITSPSTESSLE